MKLIHPVAAATSLVLLCLLPAQGTSKPKAEPLATEPKTIFEQIGRSASRAYDAAFDLHRLVNQEDSYDMRSGKLETMRINVNNLSKAVHALDSQRASLADWQTQALDKMLPLVEDMDSNAQRAVEVFNITSAGLFFTSFPDETEAVYKDASQVAALVQDRPKVAQAK